MIEKVLKTESGDVHYWISDQMKSGRETLFFLHGLTACHDLFADQIAYFDGRYNIVTWDAPITWIKDAAHNSNDDQPEQVNRHIEEFLNSIGLV